MKKLLILLAILLLASKAWGELPPVANLVAHYKCNDNATNTTVTDNRESYNGVWSRNTALDSIAGKINTSLNCNSTNYCLVDDNDAFSFTTGSADTPFSMSCWINIASFVGSVRYIAKSNVAGGIQEYSLGTNAGATILFFAVYKGDNSAFRLCSVAKADVPLGQWVHVTATYDGTGGATGGKIYINSVKKDTGWSTSGTYTCMSNKAIKLGIGADSVTGSKANGSIDDVRIYNIALTQAQIDSIYNAGGGTEDETDPTTGSETTLRGCTLRNCTLR